MNFDEAIAAAENFTVKTTYKEARDVCNILKKELLTPILTTSNYNKIAAVYKKFYSYNTYYFDLMYLLLERAPDETLLNNIYSQNYLTFNTKNLIKFKRIIWNNIVSLETSDKVPPTIKKTANQRWGIIRNMLIATDQNKKPISGKFQSELYWIEANPDSQGRHLSTTDPAFDSEWIEVWKLSKVQLSFQDWYNEVIPEDQRKYMAYYTAKEQENLTVKIKNGLCFDHGKHLIDTSEHKQSTRELSVDGFADCVLSMDNRLLIYGTKSAESMQKAGDKRHAGLLSGGPVKFAGELAVHEGKIVKITLRSGHYRSEDKHLFRFLKFLNAAGIDLTGVQIYGWSKDIQHNDASEWLKTYIAANTKKSGARKPPPRPSKRKS